LLQENRVKFIKRFEGCLETLYNGVDVCDCVVNVDDELHDETSDRQESRNRFPEQSSEPREKAKDSSFEGSCFCNGGLCLCSWTFKGTDGLLDAGNEVSDCEDELRWQLCELLDVVDRLRR
jgi:hypothetical protein